nr:tetratricopeptide-like helical domain, DYW domain protein [Tanacetum cinerariifolium]
MTRNLIFLAFGVMRIFVQEWCGERNGGLLRRVTSGGEWNGEICYGVRRVGGGLQWCLVVCLISGWSFNNCTSKMYCFSYRYDRVISIRLQQQHIQSRRSMVWGRDSHNGEKSRYDELCFGPLSLTLYNFINLLLPMIAILGIISETRAHGDILRHGFLPGYTEWSVYEEHNISLPPSQSTNVNIEETIFGQEDIRCLIRDALDPQSVRLGLASDGFNPFGTIIENRGPPTSLTGLDVLKQLSGIRFKYRKSKKMTREEDREEFKKTQNSGVMVEVEGRYYYGKPTNIIELEYYRGYKIALFQCDWVDNRLYKGLKKDKYGFPLVNFSRPLVEINQVDQYEHNLLSEVEIIDGNGNILRT